MAAPSQTEIFDRARVRQNRLRRKPDAAFLFDHVAQQLADRLHDIRRTFPAALQIGTRNGNDVLRPGDKIGTLTRMDIDDGDMHGHAEILPVAAQSYDLVLSLFDLHMINDVPGALIQMQRALRPDGLLLAAFPGGETLWELRDSLMQAELALTGGVTPRVAPFIDKQDAGALMQRARFALPVIDSERVVVTYDHPLKLLHELRAMGEGNALAARGRRWPGKALFPAAFAHYMKHHSDPDGRIRATFEIVYLSGWAPHESQQKPLEPGSAQIRLADALNTTEQTAGENITGESTGEKP